MMLEGFSSEVLPGSIKPDQSDQTNDLNRWLGDVKCSVLTFNEGRYEEHRGDEA